VLNPSTDEFLEIEFMGLSKFKIYLSKEDIEIELFQSYFRVLNRINILMELISDGDETTDSHDVQYSALMLMRERLEQAKAGYYTSLKTFDDDE
jgi:hypothetical protein